MKYFKTISATLFLAHTVVLAAPAADNAPAGAPAGQAAQFRLGLGVVVSPALYAGEDGRVVPVPLVSYESERFFLRGLGGGVHLFDRDGVSLDATLSAQLGGIKRNDFGAAELAQRGIDRNLLDDRDNSLDLGLAAGWSGDKGKLEFGIKADVSGASKGYEGTIKYGYPIRSGKTMITPRLGVSVMSQKFADYYFGTLDSEVARGVVNYKPGRAIVPSLGIDVMRPLAGKWAAMGGLTYRILPKKITDSPLIEKDTSGSASLFMAVARGF